MLALHGIINDPELTNKIEALRTDEEIRQEIKDYILDKNPELLGLLPALTTEDPAEIGGTDVPSAPEAIPPAPAPELPPEAMPPEAMPPETAPPVPGQPPVPGPVPGQPPVPMAESVSKSMKMKAKLAKAKVVKVKSAKVKTAPAVSEDESEIEISGSRLNRIIAESAPIDEDVEDFNQILRENGIEV
jgi:hypothetical protein